MKIMKIKFIIPSWHYYADPLKHQPFWELYYATQLREQGFDVSISDMRKTVQKDIISLANEIEESDFYFYWIFKSGDAAEIYSIAKFLKKKFPNSTHAAGGTRVGREEVGEVVEGVESGEETEKTNLYIGVVSDTWKK